ncbi:MAG: roadblock/LC7 domain-containing protein [Methanospirillaceae archaeon]|nr:roadblock/LC7 domain-containing protein [Methanospirillaceae archaeon]
MLKEKIATIIGMIKGIDGVTACTLVSRDGVLLGKYADTEFNEAWFAAMSATLLASAESASVIIKIQSPDVVMIRSSDGTLVILGAGEKLLITALVTSQSDIMQVIEELMQLAEEVGGYF